MYNFNVITNWNHLNIPPNEDLVTVGTANKATSQELKRVKKETVTSG